MTFSVLEDGVSEQLKLAEQRRLLSRVAMTISFILGSYFLITLIVMPVMTVGKFIAVFAALLIGSLSWLCHHEKLYTASAATIVGITIVGGFVASLSNGGADGFVAPIMISAPVTAAVFIGARATFISAVAVLLAFVSLLFLEGTGIVTEAPYSTQTLNIAAIMMLSVATGICASGVGYFAHAMQKQIRSLMASQDRLVEATQQLDHAAHHDLLTGVANRKGLNRFLDTLLAEETEHGHSLFLAHIDLDHFKTINDTHGHPVGDAVLQNAAEVMRRASLPGSMVARVGGDEFVIVSEIKAGIEFDTVQDHCNTLIQMLKTPMLAGGVRCQIGASIGFVFASRKGASVESIMTEADLALYKAKRDGRGHARAFLPHMRRQLETDHTFRLEIEDALRANQVECVLQPQACLATGRLIGMEALGRIRAQSGELLTPDRILPVLTEMGRLADFDFKVMLRGLDALVTLRRAGADLPSVSINASAVSLRSPDYVSRIVDALEQRGLSVRDVVVEILEST
ncbi:MAG: bifunctional diguanylate cyclase/phosphodiesterase, partial [Pseudomonadota bacterium]